MSKPNKTQPEKASVAEFIAAVEPVSKAEDAQILDSLFRRVTGEEPVMWGPTIIGYGSYHYVYESGREGDMCRVGFSPRKAKHSFYLHSCGADGEEAVFSAVRERLGKFKQGKGCLYVNKLADVDLAVLEEMIALSWAYGFERYPEV